MEMEKERKRRREKREDGEAGVCWNCQKERAFTPSHLSLLFSSLLLYLSLSRGNEWMKEARGQCIVNWRGLFPCIGGLRVSFFFLLIFWRFKSGRQLHRSLSLSLSPFFFISFYSFLSFSRENLQIMTCGRCDSKNSREIKGSSAIDTFFFFFGK